MMEILQDLFFMDGQGQYVWFVISFFSNNYPDKPICTI